MVAKDNMTLVSMNVSTSRCEVDTVSLFKILFTITLDIDIKRAKMVFGQPFGQFLFIIAVKYRKTWCFEKCLKTEPPSRAAIKEK